MSMKMNREISGRMSDGHPQGIRADVRSEPGNGMNSEPGLEESNFEGESTHAVSIPSVKLPDQAQGCFSKIEFDCTIPEIHRHSRVDLSVPLLRLRPGSITINRVVLDDQIPSILKQDICFYVPIVNIQQSAVPISRNAQTELVSDVQEHWVTTCATLREQTLIDRENAEETPETTLPNSPPGGGTDIPEESPDITQLLFGIRNEVLSTRRPKIILYKELPEDNTLASFETCCLRIYREQVGGNPRLQPIRRLDETIVTHLDKWASAGHHLITLDFDYFDQAEAKKWLEPKNLRDFIGRASAADYGFIIFKSRREDLFEDCRRLIQEQLAHEIGHPLDILVVKPNSLSIDEKRGISSIFWGNCTRGKEEPWVVVHYNRDKGSAETNISSHDLDVVFNKKCRGEYEKEFSSFTKGENRRYQIVTKKRTKESDEHYLMKCYVVRYLSEKYQLKDIAEIEEAIVTEKPLDSNSSTELIIPDVFDKNGNGYYEIETLFAGDRNGKELISHLSETVLKYQSNLNSARVYVVIDNVAAVRHMSDLLWLEETFRDQQVVPVRFLTLNITSKGLILIQEVNQMVQKIMHDQTLISRSGTT